MPPWIASIIGATRPRLGRAFDSQDHTLEVNLLAYGFGVVVMAVLLGWWTVKGTRDGSLVGAWGIFAAAVTGGLFKKGSNAAQQTPPPAGAPDKESGS